MDSQNWTFWLTIASLIGMAFLVPGVAIRQVVRMTRKINGLSTLMQQAHQLAYLKLTPAWETGAAILAQGGLLLLGVGLLGAAISMLFVSGQVAYGPVALLGGSGVLCLAWLGIPLKKYREARLLDKEGVAAATPLLACFAGAEGGDTAFYVAYELPGVGPIRHPVADRMVRRMKAGDPITVVYHPQNPRLFRPRWR